MKYYMNLIKNKEYLSLTIIFGFSILCIFGLYYNLNEFINYGLKSSGLPPHTIMGHGTAGLLGATNLGMAIVFLLLLYFTLVFAPKNARGSQNPEDYQIRSEGNNLYIKFRKHEFLIPKNQFSPNRLFFFDKNKKFTTLSTGYQIYNHVMRDHPKLLELPMDQFTIIPENEIVSKFKNVKELNEEEKETYIKNRKLKKQLKLPSLCFSFVSAFISFSLVFQIADSFLNQQKQKPGYSILLLITSITFAYLSKVFYHISSSDKRLVKKIYDYPMYEVNGFSYDYREIPFYSVKITDGKYIIDKWMRFPNRIESNVSKLPIKLVVLQGCENDLFELIPNEKNT